MEYLQGYCDSNMYVKYINEMEYHYIPFNDGNNGSYIDEPNEVYIKKCTTNI